MISLSLVGMGGLFLFGKACGLKEADPESPKPEAKSAFSANQSQGESRSLGFDEVSIGQEYKTSVASQSHRVSQLEEVIGTLRHEIESLKSDLVKASGSHETQQARLEELTKVLQPSGITRPPVESSDPASKTGDKSGGIRLLAFDPPPVKAERRKALRIPAGSAADGRVLNGCFAPIGGEPTPVRLSLEAAFLGPAKSRIPLTGAILIGKAQGDANTTRVNVELVSLSYVKASGLSIELPVRGYVVAEDEMEGMPGTYLYRLTDQLPLVLATEGATGFANALAQDQTTTSLTPLGGATTVVSGNALKFSAFKAAGNSTSKVGDIMADRMKEIRPAVWTPADRPVKAVFLEGVTLDGFDPQEVKDEEPAPFRDLDPRR